MIGLVIPVWNLPDITKNCLDSIYASAKDNPPFKVIVVDNASERETASLLSEFVKANELLLIRNDTNLGFIKAANQGITKALELGCEHIGILNNDIVVNKNWLAKLLTGLQSPFNYHITGFQGRTRTFPEIWIGKYMQDAYYVAFSCALIKKEVFDKIGLLDDFLGMGFMDDVDFGIRSKLAGFNVGLVPPEDTYTHLGGQSMVNLFSKQGFEEHAINVIKRIAAKHIPNIKNKSELYLVMDALYSGSRVFATDTTKISKLLSSPRYSRT